MKNSYFRFWTRNNTFTNEYDRYFECAKRGNNISSPFGGFMKENSTFPCFLVFVLRLFLGGFSGFELSFFRLLFFFLFQRERAHSCGHFPGPESFIRPLSLEKSQKEVSKSSNVHILSFHCAKKRRTMKIIDIVNFETSFRPFSKLRRRMKLSGPGK